MAAAANFDARVFRTTLGQFCTGVVIVTGRLDGEPAGFAAQSFTSLSLDPPLVALCPARSSTSWPRLRASGSFCVNILGADQRSLCELFAKTGIDKFERLDWRAGTTGSPILGGVVAWIDCDLEAEHDAGDHTIAVGRVRAMGLEKPEQAPLLFFRGSYGSFTEMKS